MGRRIFMVLFYGVVAVSVNYRLSHPAGAHFHQGMFHDAVEQFDIGHYRTAIERFRAALAYRPQDEVARIGYEVARLLRHLELNGGNIEYRQMLLENRFGNHPMIEQLEVEVLFSKEGLQEAAKRLDEMDGETHISSRLKYIKALAMLRRGERQSALALFESNYQDNPRYFENLMAYAGALYSVARFTEVLELLEQMSVLEPESHWINFNKGRTLIQLGEVDMAQALFTALMRIDLDRNDNGVGVSWPIIEGVEVFPSITIQAAAMSSYLDILDMRETRSDEEIQSAVALLEESLQADSERNTR